MDLKSGVVWFVTVMLPQNQKIHSWVQGGPPTIYKWSYNPYKWPYKWVTGVITLLIGVINLVINGRGPTLWWFQIFSIFIPKLGEMIQFDGCIFFRWVVQPPTRQSSRMVVLELLLGEKIEKNPIPKIRRWLQRRGWTFHKKKHSRKIY